MIDILNLEGGINIDRLTNKEIKNIIEQTHFMDIRDRMAIDVLHQYVFVLHENLSDLTDEEINKARDYVDSLNKTKYKEVTYDDELIYFSNQQIFGATSNYNYEDVERRLYKQIESINNAFGVNDWHFVLYYDMCEPDLIYLKHKNQYLMTIKYNMKDMSISSCEKLINDDMINVGYIYNNYCIEKDIDSMDDIKI